MGVLSEVRAQTRAVHQSLDDHPLLVQFMSQSQSEAYRGFLTTFHTFLKFIELHASMYVAAADLEILQYSPWLEALETDLNELGRLTSPSLSPPAIENKSEFWGLLYVLEGSVLGGSQVAATLPEEWPHAFLKRGAEARMRWPYFCRRLGELEAAGEVQSVGVQAGAVKASSTMIHIFDSYLSIPMRKAGDTHDRSASPE